MNDLREKIRKAHSLFTSLLPQDLQKQLKFITNYLQQHTSRAYIVGGAVRDYFNNSKVYDIDIEVYDIDPNTFDAMMHSIDAKSIGKSFFIYKYKDIDLALARSEKQTSNHHRGFEVSVEHDEARACIRRDFKINSIMLNIFSYQVLDIFNGIEDIQNKRVSIINEARFREDSLRVLRAVQFSARFGFLCDKSSFHIMKDIDILNISKSRVFIELEKLFFAPYLHIGWLYIYRLNIFEKLFNITIKHKDFILIYKSLKDTKISKDDDSYQFYFLYILFSVLKPDRQNFFKSNIFPNQYKKILLKQKYTPKCVTDRFLLSLSLKYPLKHWLGCHAPSLEQRAKSLGVYNKSFIPKVSISDVINMGFKKENIKLEFNRLAFEEIRLFSNKPI